MSDLFSTFQQGQSMRLIRMPDIIKQLKCGDATLFKIFDQLGIQPAFTNESNGKVRRVHRFYDRDIIDARMPEIEAQLAVFRQRALEQRAAIARAAARVANSNRTRASANIDLDARLARIEHMLAALCDHLELSLDDGDEMGELRRAALDHRGLP